MKERALAVWLLAAATPLLASTYYVAPPGSGGSDSHPGTLASPWATLQHAADTVQAGDTVLVRAGSYTGFELEESGTPQARIVFAAYPGETVSITADEAASPGRGAGINLEGASYVDLQGFHVSHRTTVGIRAVECQGVSIVGNTLDANGVWGILTGCCDDLYIAGNVASHSAQQHGIYVGNSGDRPLIVGNVVFGNNQNGIHMNGDIDTSCSSVSYDGVISNARVEGNVLYDNGLNGGSGGGSAINCDGVQSSLIRNNLIYGSLASGISLYDQDGGAPSNGNRVENNTVLVAAGTGRWALNIEDGSIGTTVRNNILWSDRSPRGAIAACATCWGNGSGFVSDYNLLQDVMSEDGGDSNFEGVAAWRAHTGQDLHSQVIADSTALTSLFVDRPGGNFHLRAGSAGIDAGATIADLRSDLESAPRPRGSGYDIGAFESVDGLFGDGFEGSSLLRWSASQPPP